MKLSRFAVLGLALNLLFVPVNGIADTIDPTARWLGPWSPTLNPIVTSSGLGADAGAFRSFGPLGDAEDLSGTSARSFSRSMADSATFGSASASTGVAFTRTFQLTGSPGGWDVTLSGRLVGLLFAASPTAPSATVSAAAQIGGGPSLTWGPTTIAPDRQRNIDDAMVGHSVLSDGTYTVTGSLTTSANVGATFNPFSSGGARADFATQDADGFFVGVDATPVPESSSILLFGIGIGIIILSQLYRVHKGRRAR